MFKGTLILYPYGLIIMVYFSTLINVNIITFSKSFIFLYDCNLHNTSLHRVYTLKDLSFFLDSKLSFTTHVDFIQSKANKIIDFIRSTSKDFSNIDGIITLYKSLVLSFIFYCCRV